MRDKLDRGFIFWERLNILNLDAALVAVAWQEVAAYALGAPMSWTNRWLIFFSVWIVYCCDRLLDIRNIKSLPSKAASRHRFHWKYQFSLRLLCQFLTLVAVGLALACLNSLAWKLAGFVFGLAAIHFLVTHNPVLRDAIPVIKEIRVGVIFAAGTLIQPWSMRQFDNPHGFWVWTCLALICSANCLWVSYWENADSSPKPRFLILFTWVGVVFTVSLVAIGWQLEMRWQASISGLALALSGILMLLIDPGLRAQAPRSRIAKQSLADLTLLIIPMAVLLVRWLN